MGILLIQLHIRISKIVKALIDPMMFIYHYDSNDGERIFFDGIDITSFLKNDRISQGASIVSTNKQVRDALNALQRMIANDHDLVIDGRDSGSVVFPHADHKFYLTASVDERAHRRQKQQEKQGEQITFEQANQFIIQRDQRDSSRAHAPLMIPSGAITIDGTDYSIEQVLERVDAEL